MNVIRRFGGLVTTVTAALLGACAAVPAAPRSPVTLRYAENDYLVQEIAADASGSYAVYHMGELTYLTRRLELDGDGLAATRASAPGFFDAVSRLPRLPLIPGPGAVVIRSGETVLGAAGASGASGDDDRACVEAGIRAVVPGWTPA